MTSTDGAHRGQLGLPRVLQVAADLPVNVHNLDSADQALVLSMPLSSMQGVPGSLEPFYKPGSTLRRHTSLRGESGWTSTALAEILKALFLKSQA